MKRSHHFDPATLLLCCSVIYVGCATERSETEDPISTFEIEPGFKIELLASEPLIGDPVDMEIDEYGRLYVVEMPGYPLDKSGSGKIKLLADTNGDGRMDKSTLFAKDLILPNSVMRWKKGVLVTDAPHVLYFEDTDNDGQADIRDTVLTGFALSNPQHNLNSPLLGIDNWIYLAHEGAVSTETYEKEFGDPGEEIYFPGKPTAPRLSVNAGGRAVRFRPDQYQLEILSGHTQFGHTFDAWGHHFLVGNANHLFHEVIAEPYLRRNQNLLLSDAVQSLPDHGDAAEVFPITQNPQHQLLTDIGVITSACGLTAYLGGAFPLPYDRVTFVAEPVNNLIHVDQLKDTGATFIASRLRPHKEFLASTDFRFRPVNMYVGPDGALYIVDYYRQIIEHPEWMGEEVINSGELYNDIDKGRIYRVTSGNVKADWTKGISLGNASVGELVEKLSSTNLWWRQNAQRLLIDREKKDAVPLLIKMTAHPTSAFGRLHALWTLEGLGELTPELISLALQDQERGVRENAIRLAELHLSDAPQLINALFAMRNDPDSKVRYQLLCTLGFIQTLEAASVRNEILFKDINDKWMQVAALTAAEGHESELLKIVRENFKAEDPAYGSLLAQLGAMIGAHEDPTLIQMLIRKAVLQSDLRQSWQAPALDGLATGLEKRSTSATFFAGEQGLLINTFFDHPAAPVRNACLRLLKAFKINNDPMIQTSIHKALTIATDSSLADAKRAETIDFLVLGDPGKYSNTLQQILFSPDEPLSVQLAALRTLRRTEGTEICLLLLENWKVLTPEIKQGGIRTFLSSEERISVLLGALESGKIQAPDVNWSSQVYLMAQSNAGLRDRARAIFTFSNNKEINQSWKESLQLKSDELRGKEIYAKHCALCHQIRGKMGIKLGPDLGTVHNWSPEAIMANILAPGASISSGYDLWEAKLKNGESFQGIIATETPGAITFVNAGSTEKTISRNDVRSLKSLNMSIMPASWEKQINFQEMADLLAFLKQNK